MSRTIRDMSINIKDKINEANLDIYKAIDRKGYNPKLAERYYEFSINDISVIMELHDDIVKEIESERKLIGEPPKIMLEVWNYEHELIIIDVEEIKTLQEYYKSL